MENYPLSLIMSEAQLDSDEVIEEIVDFDYDGYQVVRSEFFAHISEPSITFNNCKVALNTACMKKLKDVEYVQFLVNPIDKKLVVRACTEDAKDAFLWCNNKRKPRQITCKIFFAKLVNLMEWNPNYRYKMLGKIIRSTDDRLIIFDLNATEVYQRAIQDGKVTKASRIPVFPAEWKTQFGLPVEEHKKLLNINLFNGYTVFGISDKKQNVSVEIGGGSL